MLVEEKKIVSKIYYLTRKTVKNKKNLVDNLKKIQFSNKEDKDLSTNLDKAIYG